MSNLCGAMLLILGAWAALGVLCSGIGLLLRRAWGLKNPDLEACLQAFWLGWASVVLFLQILHLFFPIGASALTVVFLAGVAGWCWHLHALAGCWSRRRVGAWICIALWWCVVLVLANRASGPPENGDTGIYYLNAIRWASDYPVVPGLGNLHLFLALNSSHFLYASLVDVGPWEFRSQHVVNGLLLAVLLAQIAWSVAQLLTVPGAWRLRHLYFTLLLPIVLKWSDSRFWVSSPAPDLPIFILGILLVASLLDMIESPDQDAFASGFTLLGVGLLAALGVTIKLSFAVFALTGVVLGVGIWVQRRGWGAQSRKVLISVAAAMSLLIVPWMVRGIFLSGYPLFPSTLGAVPVEWRMPEEKTRAIREGITNWARQPFKRPEELLPGWAWLEPWSVQIGKKTFEVLVPLCLFGVSALFAFLLGKRGRRAAWLLLLVPLSSLVFWFLVAPDARFAGSAFWVLGVTAFLLALDDFKLLQRGALRGALVAVALLLCLWPVKYFPWKKWNGPGSDAGFHPPPAPGCRLKAVPDSSADGSLSVSPALETRTGLKEFVTRSGLRIQVPVEGDQCWEAPLPCSPGCSPYLRLRSEGDLGQGFKEDPP